MGLRRHMLVLQPCFADEQKCVLWVSKLTAFVPLSGGQWFASHDSVNPIYRNLNMIYIKCRIFSQWDKTNLEISPHKALENIGRRCYSQFSKQILLTNTPTAKWGHFVRSKTKLCSVSVIAMLYMIPYIYDALYRVITGSDRMSMRMPHLSTIVQSLPLKHALNSTNNV